MSRLPNLDGIEAIKQLPNQRVLVLTTFGLDEYIVEALRAGASGFITKDVPAEELVIGAEVLKLRRNRGLVGFTALLTVGVVVVIMGYLQIRHASNPAKYASAGGLDGFDHAVRALGAFFAPLAAILIGTEAGTADLSSGVFRDLVATGRPRIALFFVRAPAAVALTLAFTASAFLLATAATFLFAGSQATPSLALVVESAGKIALASTILAVLAVGVGSLTGSRALTLTAVIGWQFVVTELLLNVSSLGAARDGLLSAALMQVIPIKARPDVTMATGVAIVVMLAWMVVPLAVGAWRTRTQDA
jgi:CheY-like chemotaxis protein